ncbi:hypothetical protein N431DRAFT_243370 [Stipitochalara longipes BDJ]|nr:hypothetical protein N431DRAFT_243370 [Stipitochalara longipes BDJ]
MRPQGTIAECTKFQLMICTSALSIRDNSIQVSGEYPPYGLSSPSLKTARNIKPHSEFPITHQSHSQQRPTRDLKADRNIGTQQSPETPSSKAWSFTYTY